MSCQGWKCHKVSDAHVPQGHSDTIHKSRKLWVGSLQGLHGRYQLVQTLGLFFCCLCRIRSPTSAALNGRHMLQELLPGRFWQAL